jgi:hypothetical protein
MGVPGNWKTAQKLKEYFSNRRSSSEGLNLGRDGRSAAKGSRNNWAVSWTQSECSINIRYIF